MLRLKKGVENMKRFYAFMLAMILIVSSFVFSACSSQDGAADTENGTASDQTQQNDIGEADKDNGSSTNVSEADENKVDNTEMNKENNKNADDADGDNIVKDVGDDAKKTVDDVVDDAKKTADDIVDAGQR